jgi:hypothetical protein
MELEDSLRIRRVRDMKVDDGSFYPLSTLQRFHLQHTNMLDSVDEGSLAQGGDMVDVATKTIQSEPKISDDPTMDIDTNSEDEPCADYVDEPTNEIETQQGKRSRPRRGCRDDAEAAIYQLSEFEKTFLAEAEPANYTEASHDPRWKKAMDEEIASLCANKTWTLVDKPTNQPVIPCKWVYKLKKDSSGKVLRFKARLVILGCIMKRMKKFNLETFAPVLMRSSMRLIIAIAVQRSMALHSMDVDTAFLNAEIDRDDIFMSQAPGYISDSTKVCRLEKSIYGLVQAPRLWNLELSRELKKIGFNASIADPCLFWKWNGANVIIVGVYVDDLLIAADSIGDLTALKQSLSTTYRMKDLGALSSILGLDVSRVNNRISISSKKHIGELINALSETEVIERDSPMRYDFEASAESPEFHDPSMYRTLVGSMLYIAGTTRPDIAFAVGLLARFVKKAKR